MIRINRRSFHGFVMSSAASLMWAAGPAVGQAAIPFTASQASQGRAAYNQSCSGCHGPNLDDGEFAPPLRGAAFARRWGGRTAGALFTYMSSRMPTSNPGGLGVPSYVQILAYLLQANGLQAGQQELPGDEGALQSLTLPTVFSGAALQGDRTVAAQSVPSPAGGPGSQASGGPPQPGGPRGRAGAEVSGPSGGISPYADKPAEVNRPNPLNRFTPVTDTMLANPAPGEWLTWRRGYDYAGFSPLKQITKGNVANLRVAWSWTLPNGPNENTPLVHDGVLFVHGAGDKIQALDGATGDLLWEYIRRVPNLRPGPGGSKRAIALYHDKLYSATADGHMIALDAKTGNVVWDQEIAEPGKSDGPANAGGGPLVAKGKVMVGTGGRMPGGPEIVGMDAETGKVAWRFKTIAQPGEPGGNTWNGLPLEKRNGGSVWVAGSFDAALGLAYFGVAQTYDTGPLRIPSKQPGVTNDALYTDSTVALDPDTGKLKWYYQHLPNDQWDLDWVFERQLIRLPVNGQMRTLVVSAGKAALYDAIDAETGKYVFSYDPGLQNFITAVDPKTGAKTIDQSKVPGDGEIKMVCPHAGGAKSWLPASYNPNTKILYIPLVESCMDLYPVGPGGRGALSTGVMWAIRPRPQSDGKYGRVEAVNLETRKRVWIARHRAPESSGTLATAGGVVFSGSNDRFIRAFDDATGKQLWETRLNDMASSSPISYMANGKQYVAVVVGSGGPQSMTFPVLTPELKTSSDRASSIWVFEVSGRDDKGVSAQR